MNNINYITTEDLETRELRLEDIDGVSGGSFFESINADEYLYMAGISVVNCAFTSDEYSIGSKRISKDKAYQLRSACKTLWDEKYSESGDLVGFVREWKSYLLYEHDIQWDGKVGTYSIGF